MTQSRATQGRGPVSARIRRFVALALLATLAGGLPLRPPAILAQVAAPPPATRLGTPPPNGAGPGPSQGRRIADLTTRYRFIERHATRKDPARPGAIVQSRIAVRETIKIDADNPRGAPERKQVVGQTIYTEHPAEIGSDGLVSATVRLYDTFRLNPDPGSKPSEPRPLEGLLVWYQARGGEDPLVLSLSEGRRMRESEFTIISRQVFLPALSAVLPSLPSRIGDSWRVPRGAVFALLGERTQPGDVFTATFQDLRTEANGPNLVAILAVTGQATLASGATTLNAQIQFAFPPPSANSGESSLLTVDARGAISEVRSAQATTANLPGSNGRLHQTQTREIVLARQRDDDNAGLLPIPDPKPTPTEANSWLTYVDPRRRFHFQHPQTLLADTTQGTDSVELIRVRPDGPDAVGIQIQPKTGDAEADRRNLDPEFHRKTLEELWRQERQDVLPGSTEWLPEAEWKPAGMKVFRIEAALRLVAGRSVKVQRRIHLDYYLILTNRPESLVVTARTVQDPPTDFRKEVEDMIKTFRFGPPDGAR